MEFDKLWQAYPTAHSPCSDAEGSPNFPNQCAIRFGLALGDAGVDLTTFNGVRCWFGHGKAHLLRGEEIAAWMIRQSGVFGPVIKRRNADEDTFAGLRGMMFCRNFWGPGNQGDHIDLWNRDHFKTGVPGYIARSEEVWFWSFDETTLLEAKNLEVELKKSRPSRKKNTAKSKE